MWENRVMQGGTVHVGVMWFTAVPFLVFFCWQLRKRHRKRCSCDVIRDVVRSNAFSFWFIFSMVLTWPSYGSNIILIVIDLAVMDLKIKPCRLSEFNFHLSTLDVIPCCHDWLARYSIMSIPSSQLVFRLSLGGVHILNFLNLSSFSLLVDVQFN